MATAKPARESGPTVDPVLSSSSGPAVNAPVPGPGGGAAPAAPPPRLLQRLREAIQVRHDSIRTETAYVDWVRGFIHFHGKRHPSVLQAGYDIRTVQEMLGRSDVATTMVCTHVLNRGGRGVRSPLDQIWAGARATAPGVHCASARRRPERAPCTRRQRWIGCGANTSMP